MRGVFTFALQCHLQCNGKKHMFVKDQQVQQLVLQPVQSRLITAACFQVESTLLDMKPTCKVSLLIAT
jgi:hypothetical protein